LVVSESLVALTNHLSGRRIADCFVVAIVHEINGSAHLMPALALPEELSAGREVGLASVA
jgi:hypothetical protein